MIRTCFGCGAQFEAKANRHYCDSCTENGVSFICADCGKPSTVAFQMHKARIAYSANPRPLRCPECASKYPSSLYDETNSTFGCMTVVRLSEIVNGMARWFCRCECGWEGEIFGNYLRKMGDNLTCKHPERHIGKTYGDYTIREISKSGSFNVECVCGHPRVCSLGWLEKNKDYKCNHKKARKVGKPSKNVAAE